MRKFAILTAALALAACGGAADEAPMVDSPMETGSVEAPMPVEPDSGPDDVNADGAEPLDEVATALDNRIPTRFHGVWDYVEGTCALESDMRMEVSGSEILFYESIGTVTAVNDEGEDVLVALAMEGEGETWQQTTRLSLVGEGAEQRLETSDGEAAKVADEYPSKRCPT